MDCRRLVADDIFVPDLRVALPAAIARWIPRHRVPRGSVVRSAIIPVPAILLVGPMLGIATQVLGLVIAGRR